ncbi:AI-2E family transporter [uncultured Sneathiella sp.]|jgi:predicted PurR-regulated permease PerM|uniref:AI-2E family transporter n=1 Tax=uncultured Sneathiella sp. TaxID=879315 RepID=UPI0030D99E91|tara:strand:+ start:13452 stop:14531 length:1080 start_codon:yes stop_codon:yes gene_type:complete
MTLKQQLKFWVIALVAFVLFLVLLSNILLPFVLGMGVAYFLDPVADRLEEKGMSRTAATALIIGMFLILVNIALILIVPILIEQVLGFMDNVPEYYENIRNFLLPIIDRFVDLPAWRQNEEFNDTVGQYIGEMAKKLASFSENIVGGGLAFVNLITLLVISPVVAFYLLRDWDHIVERIDGWLPKKHAKQIRMLAKRIDDVLAGFVRGQSLVCLILAAYYGLALMFTGLEFGFLIGIITGLISFIPFVGAIIGFIASVGVALIQFWPDYIMIGAVVGIFIVGQILEGYVLVPNLVGGKVGLHPVWVMFGLLAGGSLFGFVGVLLAVPMAAVIGVLSRFAIDQYLQSPLYGDHPPNQSDS